MTRKTLGSRSSPQICAVKFRRLLPTWELSFENIAHDEARIAGFTVSYFLSRSTKVSTSP